VLASLTGAEVKYNLLGCAERVIGLCSISPYTDAIDAFTEHDFRTYGKNKPSGNLLI
jgi:hypothetical protein